MGEVRKKTSKGNKAHGRPGHQNAGNGMRCYGLEGGAKPRNRGSTRSWMKVCSWKRKHIGVRRRVDPTVRRERWEVTPISCRRGNLRRVRTWRGGQSTFFQGTGDGADEDRLWPKRHEPHDWEQGATNLQPRCGGSRRSGEKPQGRNAILKGGTLGPNQCRRAWVEWTQHWLGGEGMELRSSADDRKLAQTQERQVRNLFRLWANPGRIETRFERTPGGRAHWKRCGFRCGPSKVGSAMSKTMEGARKTNNSQHTGTG